MHCNSHISTPQVFCIILDMMSVCFVDPSAIKTLIAMYKEFNNRGLLFCIADCSGKIINHKSLQVSIVIDVQFMVFRVAHNHPSVPRLP